MSIPPAFLDELRARVPLSDVVGKHVRLIRAGREFKGLCPFHNEKTPSFYVNDAKGFFHCFGCGRHGDVIGFLIDHDRLGFPEAVEQLAGMAGLEVPKAAPEDRARAEQRRTLYDAVEAACRFFEAQLRGAAGRRALAYLQGRGLDDEAIARFRLGFAPAEAGALPAALKEQGFAEEMLVEAGLARRPDDGRAAYAFFRNRVMFPVGDPRGRVVAFGGRILDGDGPKYINTAETPLFDKGRLLYNLAAARTAGADQPVLVVEGYMDVIALVWAGFAGAVAPLGTALTEAQIAELWKLARVPVLCFDGDEAGRRAASRAADRVLPHLRPDHSVRIGFLPEGEDPDDLVRRAGAGAMRAVIDGAHSLADLIWEREMRSHPTDTPEGRAGIRAGLDGHAARIAGRTVQGFYRRHFAERLAAAFPWPGRRGGTGGPGRRDTAGKPMAVAGPRPQGRAVRRAAEQADEVALCILLATALNHPQLHDEFGEELGLLDIPEGEFERLRRELAHAAGDGLDRSRLHDHLSRAGLGACVERVLSGAVYDRAPFARPEAPPEQVRAGWRAIWQQLHALQVRRELGAATERLGEETTDANFSRLRALRLQARYTGEEELGTD